MEVKGYVPTIVAITFTAGLQMAMLGVLGEYLWWTFDEVCRRPAYVIDQVYGTSDAPSDSASDKRDKFTVEPPDVC